MKKLLMSINGAELGRRIGGSILLVVAAVLFALGLWLAPIAKAVQPAPTATPDFDGANDPEKCTICHVPPGNPANAHTIVIGCSAVDAHLRNHPGDSLGACPNQPTPTPTPTEEEKCVICHLPPGNPANAQTLTIGCSAVQAHLRNHPGDCLGPCPCQPTPKTNP